MHRSDVLVVVDVAVVVVVNVISIVLTHRQGGDRQDESQMLCWEVVLSFAMISHLQSNDVTR